MATDQLTNNCITLKGSAQIIAEYLKYGINSILFQRGIYPPESFINTQQYGLTILMSQNPKIEEFIKTVLSQIEEWLSKDMVKMVTMVITNAHTQEVLESWEFIFQSEVSGDGGDQKANGTSAKELKRIQSEIRDVMRQISATVSYLPLLECVCTFDLKIHTNLNCDIPENWKESDRVVIQDMQTVELRSFSTGLHKVNTVVNYKMTS